jgi:hypothetical protein
MSTNSRGRDRLHDEIKIGGKESPCPFCAIPRVRRSDYVRCCRCGINWLDGEPLDQDPRNLRLRNLVDEMIRTGTASKGKREEQHAGR